MHDEDHRRAADATSDAAASWRGEFVGVRLDGEDLDLDGLGNVPVGAGCHFFEPGGIAN
jgi:hypothetical protein